MIILNPKQLAIVLQSQSPICTEVLANSNELANQLIKNLQIQSGFGLAGFLNVDSGLDNFNAVRLWVNKQLLQLSCVDIDTDTETMDWLYKELEQRFYDCMPELG